MFNSGRQDETDTDLYNDASEDSGKVWGEQRSK